MATTSSTKATKSTTTRRTAASKSTDRKTATANNGPAKPAARASTASGNAAKKPASRKSSPAARETAAAKPAAARQDSAPRVESVIEPFQALQTLALENTGKLVALQIGALRRYSDAMLSGCREISSIEDAEALQDFMTRQGETVGSLTAAVAEDLQAATRMGMDYVAAAGDIIGRSFNKAA